jgi:ribosome-associated translation inhibitor RaiA
LLNRNNKNETDMTIQFNTDKTIDGSEKLSTPYIAMIEQDLERFSDYITRIEVHLSDQNGKKGGLDDIRCMIEARLEGRQPIAVTADADSKDQAISAAIDKLKNSLDTILGKLKDR